MKVEEKGSCSLCGYHTGKNPVTKIIDEKKLSFCCKGCEFVYDIFVESGKFTPVTFRESDLFKKYVESGFLRIPELTGNENKSIIDQKLEHVESLNLRVEGMWCAICANMIDYVLKNSEGIISSNTNFASDTSSVTFSPYHISKNEIVKRINDLGYKAFDFSNEAGIKKERRNLIFRVGLGAALALNIMMLNIVFYPGVAHTINSAESMMLSFLLLLFTTPLIFIIGYPVLKKAFNDIRYMYPGMEVLVTIGILTAYFYSIYVMVTDPNGELYFDTSGNLMALILIGKFIESNARLKASESLSILYKSIPSKIRLVKNEIEKFISIKEASLGDEFIVKEGEMIPIDGVIISGDGEIDESMLTGESKSVKKTANEKIFSGSILKSGFLKAKVINDSDSSILNVIVRSVESALNNKPKIQQLTDKIALYFTPAILLISLLTLTVDYWFLNHGFSDSLIRSISVIVIACPCAMAIAVPLAILLGISSLARKGIVVKSADLFELKDKKTAIMFDKTGTVTEGKFKFRGFINISKISDDVLLGLLYSAELKSSHLIADEIVSYLKSKNLQKHDIENFESVHGKGLRFNSGGISYRIGRLDFCVKVDELRKDKLDLEMTTIFISGDGELLGFAWLGDDIKSTAFDLFKELKNEGYRTHIISGDGEKVVKSVAQKLSADEYRSSMLPQDKINYIEEYKKQGYKVIMIGDGINDAPSLAAADVGIAVGSGSDLAKTSSSVNLLDSDLMKIHTLLGVTKKVKKVIKQNLFWSLSYNTLAIYFALTGALNPFIAVIAMIFSSLSVTFNSLRLKK